VGPLWARLPSRMPWSVGNWCDAGADLIEAVGVEMNPLAKLTPADRSRLAFPSLTPRQIEVASWIAPCKSNDEIAGILDVGVDAIKAHIKAINSKIDSDSRRAAIVIAHTTPPFADLPPLWKLGLEAWG
ncbi:helix-turn-helix transcriptional regulator, partial [Bradyrhizobium sp. BRP19]|nr:helix-turn-helix transcriptional regulator [Bradyrhizobium sp. BRP19]